MVSCLAVVTAAVTLLNIPQHNPDMKVTSKTCHFYNQFNIKWKQWFLFLLKVTEQNFQLLFLEPPLDKNGTTTAPAIEKSLTAQCICLGSEWQGNRRMDRTEVCIYIYTQAYIEMAALSLMVSFAVTGRLHSSEGSQDIKVPRSHFEWENLMLLGIYLVI